MRNVVAFLMIAFCAVASPAEPDLMTEVTERINQAVQDKAVRAAAVGIYDGGESRVVGFGQLGRNDRRVPAGDTVFEIGSVGKVFTALLVQVQVDAGSMAWDDPISRYLPGQPFVSDAVASITLRELATHTAGLPRLPDNFSPSDPLDPYAGYDRAQLMAFLAAYDPGELPKRYEYSNLGSGLLGLLAAEAARTGYAQAVGREVLEPLGMQQTGVGVAEGQQAGLAQGFSAGRDVPNWGGFDALAGAGALVSSIDDMLSFVQANLQPGELAGALKAIQVPQGSGTTGLGWHLHFMDEDDMKDDPVLWHNGGTGGYASFLAIRPASSSGVVILTASTEYDLVTELGFAQITGAAAARPTGDLTPYLGAYRLDDDFVLTVYRHGDELFAQATGQGAFRLREVDEHTFTYAPADIRLTFDPPRSGLAPRLTLQQGETVTPAPRITDARVDPVREIIPLDAAVLAEYAGTYALAPAVLITVEARGEQLYAQLTGQAQYPVFSYRAGRFLYKIVDARLEFERDESGAVVAVVLHQNGRQRAPRVTND